MDYQEPDNLLFPSAEQSLLDRIKENLLHPAQYCRRYRGEGLGETFRYYAKVLASSIVLQLFWMLLIGLIGERENPLFDSVGLSFDLMFIVMIFTSGVIFIVLLIAPFFDGLFTHIGVLLAGGKQDYVKTVQALVFSYIPYLLFPVILVLPGIFIATILFSTIIPTGFLIYALGVLLILVLVMIGWFIFFRVVAVRELQYLSTTRAIFAALFPYIVTCFLIILLFGLGSAFSQAGSVHDEVAGSGYNSSGIVTTPVNSSLLLSQDELPAAIRNHRESEVNLALVTNVPANRFGCLEMFSVVYSTDRVLNEKSGLIHHDIMEFPKGKAVAMMQEETDTYKPVAGGVPKELPCPSLGDSSACFRTTMTDAKTGSEYDSYVLIFRKGDVVETITSLSPNPDFDLIKDIGSRAAAKIPDPTLTAPAAAVTPISTVTLATAVSTPPSNKVSYAEQSNKALSSQGRVAETNYESGGDATFTSINPPQVRIRLDNIDMGETPLTITDVPFGQHSLYATKAGYTPIHELYYVVPHFPAPVKVIQLKKI